MEGVSGLLLLLLLLTINRRIGLGSGKAYIWKAMIYLSRCSDGCLLRIGHRRAPSVRSIHWGFKRARVSNVLLVLVLLLLLLLLLILLLLLLVLLLLLLLVLLIRSSIGIFCTIRGRPRL